MSNKFEFLLHFPIFTWDYTPEVIEKRSMDLISDIKKRIEKLTYLTEDKINFDSVCEPLANIEAEIQQEKSIIEVYLSTSPIREVQDKCFELNKKWSDFLFEFIMRRDIYDLLIKVQSKEHLLPYESERYLEKSLLYKRRNGLHLEADDRKELTSLLKKISNLCIDFNKNIADVDTKFEFTKKDLFGMPEDFLKSLGQKDDKYIVTLQYLHVYPILKQCKIIKTRQILERAHNSRCIDQNVEILEHILELRNKVVKILGYKTHADFVTEILMSKSAAKVSNFLKCVFDQIQNAVKTDMKRLLRLKRYECKEMMVRFDGKINSYDFIYYQNRVEKEDYQIDKNLIKEYFPFKHVTTQLLEIYQMVLCLKFEQVKDPPVIHPDVLLFAVYDKATNSLMGYFYMDLYRRPFKHYNAACYSIQAGCHYKNKPQLGCAVMIANFNKPLPDKPSLLTHEEVLTLFHEFGHVMHNICSKTKYSIFQ